MAKEFFKNLPDTSTPLEASRLNGLLDGEEPMGNLVVDSIKSKNMWKPIFGNSDITGNCKVVIEGDKYKLTTTASATGEAYFGQVRASGSSYNTTMGILYAVEPNTTYSFSVSNGVFDQNYLTQYNSSKVSLGFAFKGRNFTFTTPSNCYYITIRIGVANITASTTYETTVQLEKGDTITTYAPYQNLDGIEYYTLSESKIGIWINGKPLYRKVIDYVPSATMGATGQQTNISINHNISNLEQIIKCNMVAENGSVFPNIGSSTGTSTTSSASIISVGSTQLNFRIINDTWGVRHYYIILEYTKTTD